MYLWNGYQIYPSYRGHKKYYALVGGKQIHFGDRRYGQYYDKIGLYRDKDHLDPVRRANYKSRHEKNRHTRGTAGWFADQILW